MRGWLRGREGGLGGRICLGEGFGGLGFGFFLTYGFLSLLFSLAIFLCSFLFFSSFCPPFFFLSFLAVKRIV